MPSWFSRFWFPNLFLLLSFGLLVGWSPLSGASANPSSIPMSKPSRLPEEVSLLQSSQAATSTIHFAVIGDYGSGNANEAAVADLVKSWNPDFIITTGDNNYPSGAAATIDQNIGQYYHNFIWPYHGNYTSNVVGNPPIPELDGPIFLPIIHRNGPSNRFFPTLGNHDWLTTGANPYFDYFTLPGNERYYDFVRGPVHLFALNSDLHEPDGISSSSAQAIWLRDKLAASTSCWNLVYFHVAPFSSGPHGSNPVMQWPFQTWGADAVLAGHDHTYERIVIDGFPYFVNGLGGYTRYAFDPTPVSGSQVRYNADFGAMRITAEATGMTYEFIALGGTVVDTYSQVGGCPSP